MYYEPLVNFVPFLSRSTSSFFFRSYSLFENGNKQGV